MRPVRDDDRLERPFDYDAALDALDCDDAGEPSPDPPPANAAAWYDAGRCRNTGKRRAVCLCDACASRCAADEQAQGARADASWARNARAEREAELDAIRRAGKPAVSWAAAAEGDDDDGSCYGPRSSVASFDRSSCDSLQYEEEGGDAGEGGGASERGSREAERVVFAVPGPARGGRVSVRDPSDDALDASPPPRMRRALSSSAAEDDIRCFADALSCLTAPLRLLLAAAACLLSLLSLLLALLRCGLPGLCGLFGGGQRRGGGARQLAPLEEPDAPLEEPPGSCKACGGRAGSMPPARAVSGEVAPAAEWNRARPASLRAS